jgi:hypothetical protein
MKISIDITELEKFNRRMVARGEKVQTSIKTIITKALFIVERYAKYFAPVKTGRLRASIGGGSYTGGSFQAGEGIEVNEEWGAIGPTVVYAKYVHARIPFMWAAAQKSVNDINQMVKKEIAEAIK